MPKGVFAGFSYWQIAVLRCVHVFADAAVAYNIRHVVTVGSSTKRLWGCIEMVIQLNPSGCALVEKLTFVWFQLSLTVEVQKKTAIEILEALVIEEPPDRLFRRHYQGVRIHPATLNSTPNGYQMQCPISTSSSSVLKPAAKTLSNMTRYSDVTIMQRAAKR